MANNNAWINNLLHVQDIRRALVAIGANTRRHVQYNHAVSIEHTHSFDTAKVIKSIVRECVSNHKSGFNDINRVLTKKIRSLQFARQVATMEPSEMSVSVGDRKYKAGCGAFNPRVLEELDQEIESLEGVGKVCAARKVLVVPKNGDKASSDYRKFITKPYIFEVILGSLCNRMKDDVRELEPIVSGNMEYHVYGARIIEQRLTKYVIEYGDFVNDVMSAKDDQHFMYFDIKSFFQSIDTNRLAEIMIDNLQDYQTDYTRQVREFIRGCFVFPTIDLRENFNATTEYNSGLTIETHYQHFMANMYLREIMTAVFTRLKYMDDQNVKVVSYIDDFYLFGDSKEAVQTVFYEIKAVMMQFCLGIADQKTSKIMNFGENKDSIKQLSRLPTVAYFEMINTAHADGDFVTYFDSFIQRESGGEGCEFECNEESEKVYFLFKNKINVMGTVDRLRDHLDNGKERSLTNTLAVFREINQYPRKIQVELKHILARLIFDKYNGKVWNGLYAIAYEHIHDLGFNPESIDQAYLTAPHLYWRGRNSAYHTRAYYNRASKAMMYIQDLQFWIDNRHRFIVPKDEAGRVDYLRLLDTFIFRMKEGTVDSLECMQQFALTKLPDDEMFRSLFASRLVALKNIVMEMYPAKINYMAGIVRTFADSINKTNIMNLITRYTEEDADQCLAILSTSVDPEEINKAYFAYRFYRYNIIP